LKTYGHFDGLYVDELIDVPWFVCEYTERKTVRPEAPVTEESDVNADAVEARLRQLGYKI
jgi:hypothetical protein